METLNTQMIIRRRMMKNYREKYQFLIHHTAQLWENQDYKIKEYFKESSNTEEPEKQIDSEINLLGDFMSFLKKE